MMEDLTQDNSEPTEQTETLTGDAVPLCPNCLEPCDPLSNYCSNCGSNEAINPLASYMPFVNIRFTTGMFGKLWRKSWSSQTSAKIRWLYIWIAFLYQPVIFVIGLPFMILHKTKHGEMTHSLQFLGYLWAAVVFIVYILFIMMFTRVLHGY